MQCINCSVVWSDLFKYANKTLSLEMIEMVKTANEIASGKLQMADVNVHFRM